MTSPTLRFFRFRGLLAVVAALLVRCSPDAVQCVALPGSSVYLLPRSDPTPSGRLAALALRGRAALFDAIAIAHARLR